MLSSNVDGPEKPPIRRDILLAALERWWNETQHPLFAIEAVAYCCRAYPSLPLPDWCLSFVGQAMSQIIDLAVACDEGGITAEEATAKVGQAVGLVRQGTNAFRTIQSVKQAILAAESEFSGREVTQVVMAKNSITSDRARRIIGFGYRLLGIRQHRSGKTSYGPHGAAS